MVLKKKIFRNFELSHFFGGHPLYANIYLRIGVALDLHPQVQPGAIVDGLLRLESGEEGGRAHQGVVRWKSQLLGMVARPGTAGASTRIRTSVGL